MASGLSEKSKSIFSYIGLFAVAMIWGLAFTAVKASLDYVPPIYLIALRFTIAAVGMIIIFWPKLKGLNKSNIKHGIILGIILFLSYLVQTIGCKYTTAGKNAFLTALYIIVVPFVHYIISRKRPGIKVFIAAVIALTGVGLISLQGDLSINMGDVLSILCGILFGIQIAYLDDCVETDDPVILTMFEMAVSGILGWCVAPFAEGAFPVEAVRTDVVLSVLYLGLMSSLLANLLQAVFQKYTKPENAALIMSTESLFGALGSFLILGELMSTKTIIGCVLMMAAIVISQVTFKSEERHDGSI